MEYAVESVHIIGVKAGETDLRIGCSEGEDSGDFKQFGPPSIRTPAAKIGML